MSRGSMHMLSVIMFKLNIGNVVNNIDLHRLEPTLLYLVEHWHQC